MCTSFPCALLRINLLVAFQNLENAFTCADRETFERLLYQRIREVALAVCQPKMPTVDVTQFFDLSTMKISLDVELSEYNTLLTSIFADFEAFLALEQGKTSAAKKTVRVGLRKRPMSKNGAHLASLNAHLTAICPKVRSSCGHVFTSSESVFICNDCSTGVASCLCKTCFFASIHTKHNYEAAKNAHGFCACGQDEVWTSGVCCRIHGGDELQKGKNRPKSGNSGDGAQVLRTVEEEQRQEMERLQQRLEALPLDVVKRCTYLLRPLIDSATLALFGLIQVGDI
ncbi:unnamed protein product [Dibothriocephalus latus]|uniref:E3 ubiquitin-protein ligase n=1 Tax=Dibothriocephalus latus TaxID=60516 RepID=A0A3P7KVY3_DIBLA|nr:unnamed protein product [Dibothriocephalus latus]